MCVCGGMHAVPACACALHTFFAVPRATGCRLTLTAVPKYELSETMICDIMESPNFADSLSQTSSPKEKEEC